MVSLPIRDDDKHDSSRGGGSAGGGCGTSCGAGLEKVYPTTAVRFGAMNWIGEFSYRPGTVFRCGGKVVIQTDRGTEIGEQVSLTCNGCSNSVSREQIRRYIDYSGPEFYELRAGRILREATPQDLADQAHLNATIREDVDRAAMLAMQMNLDLKIVTVERLFGGERIVFYFRSEERIDFRTLVRDLAAHYRTRIEMRQVGARDEARLVADYEVCGRECCCKAFLKKLRPVNMRMAKLQKSTLDPSKVSGRCGRLRCCLRYEHEAYESLNARLPRNGSRVRTAAGDATVIDRQVLTQLLLVRLDDDREMAIPLEDVLDGAAAPPRTVRIDDLPDAPPQGSPRGDRPERRSGPAGDGSRRDRPPRPDSRRSAGPGRAPDSPVQPQPPIQPPSPAPRRPEDGADGPAEPTNRPPEAGPDGGERARRLRRRRRGRGGGGQAPGPDAGGPPTDSDAGGPPAGS
ncbi:MAG: hypothetical protein IPM64_11410 [Phycisphaerales bacterium]|nr:hypothetical protein [Phycisphaerales bacterium]